MPSEVRHLMFRTPELVLAMQGYFRQLGRPLSSGLVAGCVVAGDGVSAPVTFHLRLHEDAGTSRASEVVVDSATLTAALILHCRATRVPLPARAQKSLQRMGEHVCLVAKLG